MYKKFLFLYVYVHTYKNIHRANRVLLVVSCRLASPREPTSQWPKHSNTLPGGFPSILGFLQIVRTGPFNKYRTALLCFRLS